MEAQQRSSPRSPAARTAPPLGPPSVSSRRSDRPAAARQPERGQAGGSAGERPTLYLLDGTYYVFRAYHAIRELRNRKGFPTNGLFAFTAMLLNVIRDLRPSHLAVVFDPKGGSFRDGLYAEYKANRAAPPEDLVPQIPLFRQIVEALRIPVLEVEGYEADDVIATLVKKAEQAGVPVVILSADKDLYQLLDERTVMLDAMRNRTITLAEVHARYQVGPERVADVQALVGDSSDNVPGVPGIGEKTAGKLIAQFGGLEQLFANLERVSGLKRRQALAAHREQALLARELVRLRTDAPVELDLERLRLQPPDFARFEALCAELDFTSFPDKLRELFAEAAAEEAASRSAATAGAYTTVLEEQTLRRCLREIRAHGRLSFDLETTSTDPLRAEIVGFALAWRAGHGVYVPVAHRGLGAPRQLGRAAVLAALRPLLEDPALPKIGHHTKYEITILRRHGIEMRGIACDTMLAAYLLDPNRRRYKLDVLAWEYLGYRTIRYAEVAGRGKHQRRFDEVEVEAATRYAAEDADITLRLAEVLLPELERTGLARVHAEIELPLAGVLARMEQTGIRVDVEILGELAREFRQRLAALEERIYAAAGERFLINSPRQLAHILFGKLGLKAGRRGKTGPSTDQRVLESLREAHPLPGLILEHRQLQKLVSTYIEALPKLVRPETGRVHTDFHQAVAATGRLSSSDPNLQNIPVRTEEGRRIRQAFVPEPGWVLLGADYSQIELRLLAHMSGDPVLIEAFQRGEDIHARTAAELFGVPLAEVSREQRHAAKAINFGLIYGMGAARLGRELGLERRAAEEYIARYFERLPRVRPFLEGLRQRAREVGYAETLFGRRRPIPELQSERETDRALGERLAVNTPIQGSAADLIKVAMVRIDRRLQAGESSARMLLQVHDELLFEVPPAELEAARELVRHEMENALALAVPLRVEIASGPDWASLK
ncbi:MAG: DNA polymerase [Planctomycetota bacterium]|nr:MAG: DNA polymerase [Planctomycetota bacterium]